MGNENYIQVKDTGTVANAGGIAAGERGYAAGGDINIHKTVVQGEAERPFLDFKIMKYTSDVYDERLGLYYINIINITAVCICIELIGEFFKHISGYQNQHIRHSPLQKFEGWRILILITGYSQYDRSTSKIIAHYKDINGNEYRQEFPLNHVECARYKYPKT